MNLMDEYVECTKEYVSSVMKGGIGGYWKDEAVALRKKNNELAERLVIETVLPNRSIIWELKDEYDPEYLSDIFEALKIFTDNVFIPIPGLGMYSYIAGETFFISKERITTSGYPSEILELIEKYNLRVKVGDSMKELIGIIKHANDLSKILKRVEIQ